MAGRPLLDFGNAAASAGGAYAIANPLLPPVRHPPARQKLAPGTVLPRPSAGMLDIGAYQREDSSHIFANGFEG